MSEEKNEQTKQEQAEQALQQQQQKVELTLEQYSMLLDRLAELESLSTQVPAKSKSSEPDIESLAYEGTLKQASQIVPQVKQPDFDSMSPAEIVQHFTNVLNEARQAVMKEIETLKVLREIDKCEAKYEDFWQYKDDMHKICMQNPLLSIEQAYKLAKHERSSQPEEKDSKDKTTITQKLLKLPPRVPPPGGEKPGLSPAATKPSRGGSIKEAAMKAWEEVVGAGKTQI